MKKNVFENNLELIAIKKNSGWEWKINFNNFDNVDFLADCVEKFDVDHYFLYQNDKLFSVYANKSQLIELDNKINELY